MSNFSEAIDKITGDINWNCHCMGNNTKGPCKHLFKSAFTCFVKNQTNPENCQLKINLMQECQNKFENFYKNDK